MAPELIQGPGERRAGPPFDAAVPPDPHGRSQQQARIQNEQRLLEPGPGAPSEHGPEPVQLKPELASAWLHELHPGPLAVAAEQQQPEPRHHAGRAGPAEPAEPAAAAEQPAERAAAAATTTAAERGGAGPEQRAAAAGPAATAGPAAAAKPTAAATGQPQLALSGGSGPRSRSGSGAGSAAAGA